MGTRLGTCASRTTAPWLCDLKQAGQGRALKPGTADLASLQTGDAGRGLAMEAWTQKHRAILAQPCYYIPNSGSAHSCPPVPQTPPHLGAPGPERCSLWETHFLWGGGLCHPGLPPTWQRRGELEGTGARHTERCRLTMLTAANRAEAGAWRGVGAESRRTRFLLTAHRTFLGERAHCYLDLPVTLQSGCTTRLAGTLLSL